MHVRGFWRANALEESLSQSNKRKADEPSHSSKRVKITDADIENSVLRFCFSVSKPALNSRRQNVGTDYKRAGNGASLNTSDMIGNDDEEQSLQVLNRLMDESVLQGSSHKIVVPDARRGGVDLKSHNVTNYGLKERPTDVTSQVLADICAAAQEDGMVAKIFWTGEQRTSEPDILNELTSEVRWLLGFPEPKKSSHALYILVFRRLRPITELHDKDLFNVWQQCVLCTWFVVSVWLPAKITCMVGHFDLWQGGVYHRDVSPPT
jgi:hypothetical protein